MASQRKKTVKAKSTRWYRGADVPMRVIRRFAKQVAEQFQPDKIILFGSYAYGTPHADSDVDILVIMSARNQLDMAFKIHWTIQPPFPLHIIVLTPEVIERRWKARDSFLVEILSKSEVLHEVSMSRHNKLATTLD
jgi:predicted nucleotidyltransferase